LAAILQLCLMIRPETIEEDRHVSPAEACTTCLVAAGVAPDEHAAGSRIEHAGQFVLVRADHSETSLSVAEVHRVLQLGNCPSVGLRERHARVRASVSLVVVVGRCIGLLLLDVVNPVRRPGHTRFPLQVA